MKKETLLFILVLTVSGYPVSAKSYNILDFGAIPNELSTKAIQQAIDACYNDGGGTVLVPAGMYITGTIILKSKITLHLEQGSELVSSKNLEDFMVSSLH
jgi:polygalacturonase